MIYEGCLSKVACEHLVPVLEKKNETEGGEGEGGSGMLT